MIRLSIVLLSTILLGSIAACSNEPIVQEQMVIKPLAMTFASPSGDSTISITHTCSCPFSWNASISPTSDTAWLTFPTYQNGDKDNVPISIKRSLLPADTNKASIIIASNSYGSDTIIVTAIR